MNKTRVFSFAIAASLLLITAMSSCQEDEISGCMDPASENYDKNATIDNGSCTYARDKFLGTYGLSQSCLYEDDTTYSITITEGPDKDIILISNFFNFKTIVEAKVNANTLVINDTKAGIVFEGTAYLLNDELIFDIEVCEADYYPCSDPDYCTLTGKKM